MVSRKSVLAGLCLGIFLTCSSTEPVFAQKYNSKVYSVNDGLSHYLVYDGYQIRDGFIERATDNGLLNYSDPEMARYRFELEGVEKKWQPLTAANTATYINSATGDNRFIAQGTNESGRSGYSTARYNFSIAYPSEQTYWSYGMILLILSGLIFGYIRIRLSNLEKQRLKRLVEEKNRDLQDALIEKEVLVKEIHHRVKNNLAIISGLLELQSGYSENGFAKRVLAESQRRVQSISMIHEKLYQNENLSEINFIKYIKELVETITCSFNHLEKEIAIEICVDNTNIGVDQGIPCGLILNELISNAYEHAFVGRDEGAIEVKLHKQDNQMLLIVQDNGVGFSTDFEQAKSSSLGLTLIETLTQQLRGTLKVNSSSAGTTISILFEKENYSTCLTG